MYSGGGRSKFWTHYIALLPHNLKFMVTLLPQFSKCHDYKQVPSHPAEVIAIAGDIELSDFAILTKIFAILVKIKK